MRTSTPLRIPQSSFRTGEAAFTKLDLLVSMALAVLLASWLVAGHTGERGRRAVCARNLAALGQAMDGFANDHQQHLVPALLGPARLSWDKQLQPYLRPDLVVSNSPYAERQLRRGSAPRLHCPSDSLVRAKPRSYAMSGHDMGPEHWPAGADCPTGVGLQWNKNTITALLGQEAWENAQKVPSTLPMLPLASLPAPADTLLLTELAAPANILEETGSVTVRGALQQAPQRAGAGGLHRSRFNYLMVDGHVECLTPLQTGGIDGTSGIWTIRKED